MTARSQAVPPGSDLGPLVAANPSVQRAWWTHAGPNEAQPGTGPAMALEFSENGHELARDQGIEVALSGVRRWLEASGLAAELELRPANLPVWADGPADTEQRPPAWSWLRNASGHRFLFAVEPGLRAFAGHFPDNPILPGVIQLHWAIALARHHFGFAKPPLEVRRLKYRNIVVPPCCVELALERPGPAVVRFTLSSRGNSHAQGDLDFGQDG